MNEFQQMPHKYLRRFAINMCGIRIRWFHWVPFYGYKRLRRDAHAAIKNINNPRDELWSPQPGATP